MLNKTIIDQHIVKLISWGMHLYAKNCVSAFDGNLSLKLDSNLILITKSGCMKGVLTSKDFVLIDSDGKKIDHPDLLKTEDAAKPSSEAIMHLMIYKHQPKAKSVFHAHPPTAVAFSVAKPKETFFPLNYTSELILALGQVPIVTYQRPGTVKMGEALVPFLNSSKVMILQFHGAVSWGETVEEAYMGIERLEHAAEIYLRAKMMGGVGELPDSEIKELVKLREKIGFKTL